MSTPRRPELDLLLRYGERNGHRMTRQRLRIADRFLALSDHVSAEDLYHALRNEEVKVGLATVYRTLRLLVDAGLASERTFPDNIARYEPRFGAAPHDHLICDKCGAIFEMSNPCLDMIYKQAQREHGFAATEHRLVIHGLCAACAAHA